MAGKAAQRKGTAPGGALTPVDTPVRGRNKTLTTCEAGSESSVGLCSTFLNVMLPLVILQG